MNHLENIAIGFLILVIIGVIIKMSKPEPFCNNQSNKKIYRKDNLFNKPYQPDDHLSYMEDPESLIYEDSKLDLNGYLDNVIDSREKMYINSNSRFDPVDKINHYRLGGKLPVGETIQSVYDSLTKGVDINTKKPCNLPEFKPTNIGDQDMVNMELQPYERKYKNEKSINGGIIPGSNLVGISGPENNKSFMTYQELMNP
jgi:hypothetical protein